MSGLGGVGVGLGVTGSNSVSGSVTGSGSVSSNVESNIENIDDLGVLVCALPPKGQKKTGEKDS